MDTPKPITNPLATAKTMPAEMPPPSTQDLLARAQRLGPARPTLESILLPTDPILGAKLEPRIAERRMRLTRYVKATLGGCVALCVAALVATATSGEASAAPRSSSVAVATPITRAPSVEALSGSTIAKATRGTDAAKITAHAKTTPRAKRR